MKRHHAKCSSFLGLPGKHDARHRWVAFERGRQQRGPVHSWHPHVRDDDVEAAGLQRLERSVAARHELHLPVDPRDAQGALERLEHSRLVVHEQDLHSERYYVRK